MELNPLVRPDYPQEPERATLYQKLTLQYWKQAIAEDRRRESHSGQQAGNNEPPLCRMLRASAHIPYRKNEYS